MATQTSASSASRSAHFNRSCFRQHLHTSHASRCRTYEHRPTHMLFTRMKRSCDGNRAPASSTAWHCRSEGQRGRSSERARQRKTCSLAPPYEASWTSHCRVPSCSPPLRRDSLSICPISSRSRRPCASIASSRSSVHVPSPLRTDPTLQQHCKPTTVSMMKPLELCCGSGMSAPSLGGGGGAAGVCAGLGWRHAPLRGKLPCFCTGLAREGQSPTRQHGLVLLQQCATARQPASGSLVSQNAGAPHDSSEF